MARGETSGPLNFFARGMLMICVGDVRLAGDVVENRVKVEENKRGCRVV